MFLNEIANYIHNQGLGTLRTDLFRTDAPNTPDDVIIVSEYGGMAPIRSHSDPANPDEPVRFQVLVRSKQYQQGRNRIETIYRTLDGITNTVIEGVRYRSIMALQTPFPIGRDENQREQFTVNFECIKERSPL